MGCEAFIDNSTLVGFSTLAERGLIHGAHFN